ncbi:MAG: hypothetical protein IJW86_08915 [Clostridia bacterium]|nr:hypothetical protein [Clostridia bacterium]
MKKTYFKKALSLIMAVMMIMSCWVWVAPQKAEAATAGNYYCKLDINTTDTCKGWDVCKIVIYYKSENGTGTETPYTISDDARAYFNGDSSGTIAAGELGGFPTKITFEYSFGGGATWRGLTTNFKLYVGSSSSSLTEVMSYDFTASSSAFSAAKGTETMSVSNDKYPYAYTITWSDTPEAMTCPKTGTATQSVSVSAKDQYGVQMFDPTWNVKGSVCETTGISVTSTTAKSESTTITLTNAANNTTTTDTQTGTVYATWDGGGTDVTDEETFTITDSYYTATFNYKSAVGADTSATRNGYHGDTITAPTAPEWDLDDYHYTFSAWSPAFASTITKDVTYNATYTSAFVEADYTGVNDAIADADAIKAQYSTEYELKYTLASRVALDNAIDAVVTGLGRTQQDVVDGYAKAINDAIAALEPNKFNVIFLDENDSILLFETDVEYKASVTPPADEDGYYDSTNHYTFAGWSTDEYQSVVSDLFVYPVYTAQAHTFETSTVTSNCVTKGATKHTCTVCGYSYVDGETDYGDHVWASDYTIDLYPTCTVAGSKSIHCTLCDAQTSITAIDPLGHQWGAQNIAVEATCGKIGIMTRVCDDCLVCEHTIIDALEHYYAVTTVAPTCTAKGYDEYVCQRDGCGHSYRDNYTNVKAHAFGAWETVYAAVCEVAGLEKRVCADCGFMELQTTAALSHITPDNWTVITNATCEGKGYQVKYCTQPGCGKLMESEVIAALGHNYVTVTTAATCTWSGSTVKTCETCGDVDTTVIEALGHNYGEAVVSDADCTHGGFKVYTCQVTTCGHQKYELIDEALADGHDFTGGEEEVVIAATCENPGEKTIKCNNCDYKITEVISKLGHDMKAGTAVDATCTTSGYIPYTCGNDGCTYTYNVYDENAEALGHDYKSEVTASATCTADGEMTYTCSRCQDSYKEVIPATGHNYVKGTVSDATCTTPATEVYTCENCSDTYTKYVAASNGHSWGNWTKVQDATEDKYGIEKRVCSVCQAEELRMTQPIGNHSFTETVTVEPDCTTEGEKTYTCSVHTDCSANYTETIPALGHTEKLVYVAATCTSEGSAVIVCETCDDELSDKHTIPMLAHSYGTGTETTKPTCTQDGVMTFTCTECNDAQRTEVIAKTGHTLSSVYNPASCEGTGSVVTSCSKCDYVLTQEIPAVGHKLEVTVNDATCTAEGTVTEKCTVCGDTKTTTLAVKNHKFGGTAISETAATCTTDGERTFKCESCDEVVTVAIPKLGHSYPDEWTTESEADCTTDGKKTKTCATCSDVITEVLPKTGHNWGAWVKVDATNDTDGSWTRTCQSCSETETVVIPKGGHAFENAPEITKKATCTETGTAVYKCSAHTDCGVTVEVTLAVTQHTIITQKQDATCEEKGYVKTVCSVCDKIFTNEDREIVPHTYDEEEFVEPTCTTSGHTIVKCTACNDEIKIYDEDKPATGHSLVEGASTATCTGEGLMTLTCENCTYSTEVEVASLGHNYVEDTAAATEATCAAAATKTYKCSRCSDSYTVSVGEKTEAHTWDDAKWQVIESATESSIGYRTNACTVCGQLKVEKIEATGEHSFIGGEVIDSEAATCTENGYETVKCTTHTDCGMTTTITLYATGHTEILEYTAATCDAAGSTKIICETCKEVLEEKEIPALDHLYGEGIVTPATCKDTGSIVYECARDNCNNQKTTVIETNANAHQYATTVIAPTCTATGSVITKCTLCDNETTNKTLEKIEHSWGTPEVTDATCEKDGAKVYTCTAANCGATKTEIIAKTGHSWGGWEVTTESTNTTEGVLTRECAKGCTEEVTIPAGGHNLVESSREAATCTKEGKVIYDCDVHTDDKDCGISVEVTLDKIQHTFTTTKADATCEGKGEVVTKCDNCDTATIKTEIPATGHTYDDGVVTDATCTAEGKIVYTCTADKCGKTKEVTLTKLQHNYVAGTPVAATCTASGYTPYKCATCDSNYVIVTSSANGHNYDTFVSSTATCLTAGAMTLKCACGAQMVTDVPALGHDYELTATTAATCADEATETYKCSRCDDSYTVSVGSKSATHSYPDTWTVEKAATDSSIGYETRECTVCGQLEVRAIDATGEHSFTNGAVVDSKAATCTEDGYEVRECTTHTDCGKTATITLTKLGHTEELKYIAATCTTAGSAKMTCKTCLEVLSEEAIPALEHAWGNAETTLSDCKTNGKVEFTCTRSGCTETHTVTLPLNADAHTTKTTVTAATCTQAGSAVTVCTKCNKELVNTELPIIPHSWANWVVTKASTNTATGLMTRTCAKGCTEEVIIPAGGHNLVESSRVDATCTKEGKVIYDCSVHTGENDCGISVEVTLDEIQHTFTTEKEDATCTKEGFVKTYCTADGCDETLVDITTGMLAHIFEVTQTVAPDCDTSGYKVYKCKNCDESYKQIDADALAHDYKEVEGSSTADCVNGGTKTLKCDKCGKEITVTVPALGHDWEEGTVTKAPTCKDEGVISFECSRCDETRTEALPTISHELTTVTTDATCTADGSVVTTCKYCDYKEEKTIAKKGHTWADTATSTVPAKCEEAGSATYNCLNCSETKTETIPALGHVYQAGDKVASTCTTSGYTVYVCKNDSTHTYKVYSADDAADGHKFGEWSVVTNATQDTDGLKRRECTVCGETEDEKIPATKHEMQVKSTTDATCTEEGEIVYECVSSHNGIDCDYTLTVVTSKIAHTLKTVVTNATCEEAGKVVTTCTNCDTVNIETPIPAMGHAWNEGEITKAATCTAEGEMTFTCKHDASHTYKKPIEMKQHNFVAGTKVDATCTESAYTPYKCSDCDESYEIIEGDALGHDYIIGESTATCEVAGTITITCSRCTEVITVDVAALGHAWGTGKVTKQPTCSAEGEIEYTCTRDNCGATKTDKLPTVDHDLVTVTTDATCTADGSVVTTCNNCDYKKTEVVKAKGHTWADTATSVVPAKCEAEGSAVYDCVNCDETKTVVIPALGHVYEAKETVASTCLTSGYTVYVCQNDNTHTYKVYSTDDTADGHNFGEWSVVTNATQDDDGLKRRECTVCGEIEEEKIPATKHEMQVKSTTAATCTAEGEIVYECVSTHDGIDCNYTLTVVTSKIAHTLKTVVTDAKCETAGSVATSCEKCDTVDETTVLPAIGHKYVGTVTKDATCEEDGIKTYTCQNDAAHAYTEIIPATGHSYTPVLTAPTCEAEGYTTYTCDCGDSYVTDKVTALGHNFGSWTDTGSDDVHTRYCSRCSETETEAHRWDDGKVTVEPSYDNPGQTLYTCGICGATKTEGIDADVDENAPTGEIKWNATLWNDFLSVITFGTYVNYDVTLEITAQDNETGVNSIEYYVADKALTLDEVKALASWIAYDSANKLTVPVVDASKFVVYAKITDNSGNETYLSTEGIVFDTTAPVLSIQADKGNAMTNIYCSPVTVIIDDANISHAIYDGKTVALTTDKFYCNEIGAHTLEVFDKAGNSAEISFTVNDGHTWAEAPLSDNSNLKSAATCENMAVYYVACPVCGEIGDDTFEYGSVLGHNYKGTVTVPASCEESGVMTYICQNDNSHTYTEAIPATGHTALPAVMENLKEATCEASGSYDMVVYCDACNKVLEKTSHVIKATGHNYVGVVTVAPTCTQEGVMTYTCANDWKHAYSEEIPALGHTDENNDCTCEVCGEKCCLESNLYVRVIEPSCTKKGYSVLTCKNCKSETKTEIPALGHKEVVTYVEATCSKYAHKIITCSACDEFYEEIYTDNAYAAHSVVVIPGKDATCVSDGYTAYERCVNCGMVTEAQTLYKEDVPHVDADGNGKCDVCDGKFFTDTKTCNCLCHGTGIKGFLYRIALFFWKIFKSNKSCACGNVHY